LKQKGNMFEFIEIIISADTTVPIHEVLLMLGILSFCLLLRKARFGLIVSYLYTFQLGARFFLDYYGYEFFPHIYIYSVFGLIVFALGFYGIISSAGK